ncbi:hypothetical protein L2E82_05479 [Cichorium intybus]|uniref:Uncharacterized protein n=1 Tax=Cichorium intybus TaxID=13427 RepID=A0ACB9H8G9_CICIN|nr:hypothetical protein L2E82_05479 [Cichorium intybus]
MRTISTNMGTIDVLNSNRSFHCYHGTDFTEENGRPSKKPKIEEQVVEYALHVGFLDPINPNERLMVIRPQPILKYQNTDYNLRAIVPCMSKQFWKACDYEIVCERSSRRLESPPLTMLVDLEIKKNSLPFNNDG